MDTFFIKGDRQKPNVTLDKSKEIFEFKGRSIISNPSEFYAPIINWVQEYCKNPNTETNIRVELDYFNSSSFKALTDVFRTFSVLKNKGLHIVWYTIEDDDIIDEAQKIMEVSNLHFDFKCLPE